VGIPAGGISGMTEHPEMIAHAVSHAEKTIRYGLQLVLFDI